MSALGMGSTAGKGFRAAGMAAPRPKGGVFAGTSNRTTGMVPQKPPVRQGATRVAAPNVGARPNVTNAFGIQRPAATALPRPTLLPQQGASMVPPKPPSIKTSQATYERLYAAVQRFKTSSRGAQFFIQGAWDAARFPFKLIPPKYKGTAWRFGLGTPLVAGAVVGGNAMQQQGARVAGAGLPLAQRAQQGSRLAQAQMNTYASRRF